MSENNLKKPFTIRDVLVSDIDAFHNKRGEIGLSGAGYFHSLLHGKDVKPSSDLITNDEVRSTNNEELINLQIKFEELANENKRFSNIYIGVFCTIFYYEIFIYSNGNNIIIGITM